MRFEGAHSLALIPRQPNRNGMNFADSLAGESAKKFNLVGCELEVIFPALQRCKKIKLSRTLHIGQRLDLKKYPVHVRGT